MKIEKIEIKNKDKAFESILYTPLQSDIMLAEKINELIDAMTCPKCGNLKGLVGSGLCFPCDQKAHPI